MTWKFLLYDWAGLNAVLFRIINQSTPSSLSPLAWMFSNILGNYWNAPLVMLGLWLWTRSTNQISQNSKIRLQLIYFIVAFGLAMSIVTALKLLFNFPRPLAVFGDLVRVIGMPEWNYSLPSGHSTYAALVVGSLWPLIKPRLRPSLIAYLVLVGWSRIASGMHFPADVLLGWIIGFCAVFATRKGISKCSTCDGVKYGHGSNIGISCWHGFSEFARNNPNISGALIMLFCLYAGYQGWIHLQ